MSSALISKHNGRFHGVNKLFSRRLL